MMFLSKDMFPARRKPMVMNAEIPPAPIPGISPGPASKGRVEGTAGWNKKSKKPACAIAGKKIPMPDIHEAITQR
jgi:hypothetical protein